jgi:hypothetical protein
MRDREHLGKLISMRAECCRSFKMSVAASLPVSVRIV